MTMKGGNDAIYGETNNRKEFKDELEDRTMPDHEAEAITCTLRAGSPPMGRRMA